MLWPCVCPSVRSSVIHRYCIETAERIELLFSTEAALDLSYTAFYETRYLRNKYVLYFWKWVPKSELSRIFYLFRRGTSTVASVSH